MISIPARFKIIGAETVAVGAFLLITFVLDRSGTSSSKWLPRIDSDLPIVGGALIFIGIEIFSLIKHLPSQVAAGVGQRPRSEEPTPEPSEGRLVSVRKLVALDMALHGRRLVLLEFGISAPALIVGGLFITFRGYWPLGAYLLLLGFNYVPLLIHAVALTGRNGELANHERLAARKVRRYGIQQMLILVPFAIPILTVLQHSVQPRWSSQIG